MPSLFFYTRPGCHLCDDVNAMLQPLAKRYGVQVVARDVSGDLELERRYGFRIPVVQIDERLELEAPITREDLERLLSTAYGR